MVPTFKRYWDTIISIGSITLMIVICTLYLDQQQRRDAQATSDTLQKMYTMLETEEQQRIARSAVIDSRLDAVDAKLQAHLVVLQTQQVLIEEMQKHK